MKRMISAVLALSLLSGTAALAKPNGDKRDDRGYSQGNGKGPGHDNGNHYGERKHKWAKGQRLPVTYYRDPTYYVDYRAVHLRAPPPGYRWVRVDNDYMMVALATGLIASLILNN